MTYHMRDMKHVTPSDATAIVNEILFCVCVFLATILVMVAR